MSQSILITYYHHSGFSVCIDDTFLLFDYWRGNENRLSEEMQLTAGELKKYKKVYVFVSHGHSDHMDPIIYDWEKDAPGIHYILAADMDKTLRGDRMKPGDEREYPEIRVHAYDSTDGGVSYYVTINDIHIFHAGDLNLWHWRDESTVRMIQKAEQAFIDAVAPIEHQPIDIAFFPLDPRQGSMYDAGANYFINTVRPAVFIPMHWQDRADLVTRFVHDGRTSHTEVVALTEPLSKAEIRFTENEMRLHVFKENEMIRDRMDYEKKDIKPYTEIDPFENADMPIQME